MAPENGQAGPFGHLVALEGDSQAISMQLRLLPPSQNILVLPALIESLDQDANDPFNPREFVYAVHTVLEERIENARMFLKSASVTHPRLVLMNGGSVAARTACLSKICDKVTTGNTREAEALLNKIIEHGVRGLIEKERVIEDSKVKEQNGRAAEGLKEVENIEDPTTRAMKAAELLDQQTAILEAGYAGLKVGDISSENCILDTSEQRVETLTGSSEPFSKTQYERLTSQYADGLVRTVLTIPNNQTRSANEDIAGQILPLDAMSNYSLSRSHQLDGTIETDDEEEAKYDLHLKSPGDVSMLHTPNVIYGEACVVDVQSAPVRKQQPWIRRVKSMDRLYPGNATIPTSIPQSEALTHARSAHDLRARPTSYGGRVENDSLSAQFCSLPRTTFVRASQTTIKRQPRRSGEFLLLNTNTHVYVDRGTDPEEDLPCSTSQPTVNDEEPLFESVFPLTEDLIIHFTSETPNEVFDYVLQSYRNGSYSVSAIAPNSNVSLSPSVSSILTEDAKLPTKSHFTTKMEDEDSHTPHEVDPCSFCRSYLANNDQCFGQESLSTTDGDVQDLMSSAPSMTPTVQTNISPKFYDFSPTNRSNAIEVQNSFRAFLNIHFPAGESGLSQYYFLVSPEAERLWKPVWGTEETTSIGREGRTVDLILALGCEDGVQKDFFALVSGQVERLGTKRDGLNRSGRLDLRYLVANVVQSYSGTLPGTRNSFSPLSNPTLLATLLIPHLEAYLATNTNIRLLILTYSAQDLSTIIALRGLLGQDILKIAGVLDSLASDPPSFATRPRTPAHPHPLSDHATISPSRHTSSRHSRANSIRTLRTQTSFHQATKSESSVSFSKANYLLPSIATDTEISNFLSGIWMSLMDKSPFYTPEPEPAPRIVEKIIEKYIEKPDLPPTPPTPHLPNRKTQPRDFRDSKFSRLTGGDAPSQKTRGHNYAPSITSTVRTTGSERVRRQRRTDEQWENFYIGEEDSEDDAYDRMIMGRSGASIMPTTPAAGRKRSSKKALKWLGLA